MLHDCVGKDPGQSELFIVLPGPAYEMAKLDRDRYTQAILPIEGTAIRCKGARLEIVLDDEVCKSVVATFGVGIELSANGWQSTSRSFELAKLRYGKIFLVTDETAFAQHVREQLTAFLFRFNHPLVKAGHVYKVDIQNVEEMSREEFARSVLAPSTRVTSPLKLGPNIKQTVARNWP